MLSRIMFLSSQKIRLLCFPISSRISTFLHGSPSSFKCSRSNSTTRSSPGCRIPAILALPICFLKSIQKFGAVRGLTLFFSVKYIRGREALAERRRRFCPSVPLAVIISSSPSGCAILLIRPPARLLFNSRTIAAMVIPSKAMIILLSLKSR